MAPPDRTADVIVIGGGIHGCSAALHLVLSGLSVIVIEKDYVGRHASGVNAGGVRRLGRDLSEIPLSIAATAYWHDIRALVDDDCGYRRSRYLKVALSETGLEAGRRRVDLLRQHGYTHEELIDADAVRTLLPQASRLCRGAIHVDGDGSANPYRSTFAFRRRAERLGARFHEATRVETLKRVAQDWQVQTSAGAFTSPVIVNAAGAWAGVLAAQLGDPVPVSAHAPMLAITAPTAPLTDAVVGVLDDALSLKQMPNGTVLIGGGVRGVADIATNTTTLDHGGIARFLATAVRVFPGLERASVVRTWAGIEGYMPDNLPVISRGSSPGVVHAFGFSAHGFQLSPAVGEVVGQLARNEPPTLAIDAFAVDRFRV